MTTFNNWTYTFNFWHIFSWELFQSQNTSFFSIDKIPIFALFSNSFTLKYFLIFQKHQPFPLPKIICIKVLSCTIWWKKNTDKNGSSGGFVHYTILTKSFIYISVFLVGKWHYSQCMLCMLFRIRCL